MTNFWLILPSSSFTVNPFTGRYIPNAADKKSLKRIKIQDQLGWDTNDSCSIHLIHYINLISISTS